MIGEQDETMTFGTFMMVVRSDINSYLQWFFQSKLFKEQISHGENTAINQITRYMLDEVRLPVPSSEDQERISKKLREIDMYVRKVIDIQNQKLEGLLKLKSAILAQELQPPQSEAA